MPVPHSSRNETQVSSRKKGKRKHNDERIKSVKLKIKKLNITNDVKKISLEGRQEHPIKIKKLKANKATKLDVKSKIKVQPVFESDEEKDQKFDCAITSETRHSQSNPEE